MMNSIIHEIKFKKTPVDILVPVLFFFFFPPHPHIIAGYDMT